MTNTDKVVQLETRDVFGVRKLYPYNTLAKQFCKIAKTSTMTQGTIAVIREMGYEVVTDRVSFNE